MVTANQRLETLLARVRARFVVLFLQECENYALTSSVFVSEQIDLNADGTIKREEVLNLPSRTPMFDTLSQAPAPFPTSDIIRFEPFFRTGKGPFDLLVKPFAWDALELSCRFDKEVPLTAFRHWYLEWFQTRHMNESSLITGAVHRMAGPRRNGKLMSFKISLGTAPIEAFVDLIDMLGELGARDVACSDANTSAAFG